MRLARLPSVGELVTENVADFAPFVQEAAAQGDRHWGVVFTLPWSMPPGVGTIGLYIDVLNAFLREHPGRKLCSISLLGSGPLSAVLSHS